MINNGLRFDDTYTGLFMALTIIYLTINMLGVLYLSLVSGEMVAKEVEDGTMRMILARPISRVQLVAIKAIVCVIHTFVFVFFIGLISLLVALIYRQRLGNLLVFAQLEGVFAFYDSTEGLWRYARALLVLSLAFQTVSGLGFFFSCLRMKPTTATILTLSTVFVDMILRSIPYFESFRPFFLTYHLSCWVLTFRYIVPWWDVSESMCYLAALTISFWVLGGTYYCTRDFKP